MTIDSEQTAPLTPNLQTAHLTHIDLLSDEDLLLLLTKAQDYADRLQRGQEIDRLLTGRTQINLFFENSTRTNSSFELAGRKLGADVLVLPVAASSVHKGEALRDTVQTMVAMGPDIIIIRNKAEDSCEQILSALNDVALSTVLVNAGTGRNSHPTQALLDAFTILQSLGRNPQEGLDGVRIAITGDIRHSRVANSNAQLLPRLGAEVRFIAPKELMPADDQFPDIEHYSTLSEGLADCHFVMGLRVQFERLEEDFPFSHEEYYQKFGLTHDAMTLARPDAHFMHPGPMNRGVEVDGTLADDQSISLVLQQVANGVATRMAILDALLNR